MNTLGVLGEIGNFVHNYNTAIAELDDPKNNGKLSEKTISGMLYGVSNIVDVAITTLTTHVPAVPAQILKFASKAINITLAYWYVNAESLQEAIESNFSNIKSLHDRLDYEVHKKSSEYINLYNNALQKAEDFSGLSINDLNNNFYGLLTPQALMANLSADAVNVLKESLNRAELFGLNESYEEAKAEVEKWIGKNQGDIGLFDSLAEIQISIWLKNVYNNALDKIQSDILSDNHQDFLSGINNQLAGIVAGFTHISPIDKAVMLASWQ